MLIVNFLTINLSRDMLLSVLGEEGTRILHLYLVRFPVVSILHGRLIFDFFVVAYSTTVGRLAGRTSPHCLLNVNWWIVDSPAFGSLDCPP